MSEGANTGMRRERAGAARASRAWHFADAARHWPWQRDAAGERIGWWREHVVMTACALVLVVAFAIPATANVIGTPKAPMRNVPLALPALTAAAPAAPAAPAWQRVEVRSGQTLSQIFDAEGLGYGDLQRILENLSEDDAQALENLHPHDELGFLLDQHGALKALRFERDEAHRVTVSVDGEDVSQSVHPRAIEHRLAIAHGVIHGSLFGAGVRAGMSEAMVMEMAEVFKYDIDFIKSIRDGDRFTVIYDNIYRDGMLLHHGDIIAAEFINQGTRYTAFRFTLPDGTIGYYDEDGRPLRKSLLRTPVKFSRISSRFSLARKHPILGYTRAHKGVDYAAPRGTPIHAAGNGVIKIRGRVHGFGRFILIKHNNTYSTAYAHMSRYAKGLHVGSHVHQGQVIGYVGMSGLATGPHLHYEVRVHGHQVNPLTVTLPKPQPLAPKLLAKFQAATAPWLARIKVMDDNLRLLAQTASAGRPAPRSP
ncbi:MAG TPA: peptidoglycan DD-metalloendopeptidase family protein [Rhodanobacteraceae bacterium]|nr:peptidoglycan DD-metalloendopeptidase family protein [Rhodanobacteraceae bacterium]